MKVLRFLAVGFLIWVVTPTLAQICNLSDSSSKMDGLTVLGVQIVNVKPEKLRLYTTVLAEGDSGKMAVQNLAEKKKLITKNLQSIGVANSAITFAQTRILEWGAMSQGYGAIVIPKDTIPSYTASIALQVDWGIKGKVHDELIEMAIEITDRLCEEAVFGVVENNGNFPIPINFPSEIYIVFVGNYSDAAIDDAQKLAFDEAVARANSIANISGQTLGKLESIVYDVSDRNSFSFGGMGGMVQDKSIQNPMLDFSRSPTEICNANPSNLSKEVSIQLRYELN